MPKTNFMKVALACIVTFFSLIGCEKMGDERSNSKTFVKGDYLLTPKVEIVVETIKEVVHDTLYYKVVVMDSIFIHDTLPPRYIYDTIQVEVPVPYPVHDTVIVVQRDTVWQTLIEERIDTLYLRDTIDKSFSGMLRGKCYVAGKRKAAVQQYILDKGEIVNQEVLYGSFKLSITAGKTEVKNETVLNSKYPNISGNMFSFDVTDGVGGANVNNVWGYEYNAVAQFDGFTETIDAELSIETADFYQRSDLEWRHMVTASLDGIPQATATWEFWKEKPAPEIIRDTTYSQAVPVSASQAKTVRTITANGQLEATKDIFVPYAVKFECGEKEMISNMSLLDYGKAVAANNGNNTVAMNIHEFSATVEVPSTLTFKDEGKQITVDFAYTNLAIESNGAITRTDNSNDKYEQVNNTAYFKLVLNGFTVATDTKEIEQKKEKPAPEVIRDTTYSQAIPVSATQAKVIRNITANGKQESSKDILVPYAVKFECGEKEAISNMATLDYGKAVAAKDGANTVAMNIHSFNATVDVPSKLTFSDEGKQISVDFAYTNLAIESNGAITRTDNSNDKYEQVNNTAYFKVVLDGFTVATDNKEIEQKKEIKYTVEWDEVKFSSDMKQVTRRGYLVKNNVRTGFYKDISVNLEYTFTPGAALEFNSNETPSIKDANAVLVGNEAYIPHTLGSTEFNANFTYGGTSRVTFSYSDEYVSDEVTVDLNITYSVKATGTIEQNGNSYSTPAALYANGVEVKNEKFVFEVKPIQATYSGYRVYNAGQWAITRIYNQDATTSLVVLVGTLEHIQTGKIYAIHQVLEGSADNLPKPKEGEKFLEVSTPTFAYPYSMFYNVATSAWEYGSIVGAKKGATNAKWMYQNWAGSNNQMISSGTSTDLLDDVVLYQIGSEDNISSEAGTISLSYNGQTITVVSDK